MPGLGRLELERRIGAQRLAEFVATGPLAAAGAMDKGEVLVRVRALAVGQAEIDRTLEVARCLRILAVLVLAQPGAERRGAFARLEQLAQRLRGTAAKRDQEAGDHERAPAHRKRCRTRTASPAFTCMRSTCAGKVELRISMVCAPGATSKKRSVGLTPRRLPSSSTSPQGATASSSRPMPAGIGVSFSMRSNFLSTRAASFLPGAFSCPFGSWSMPAGGSSSPVEGLSVAPLASGAGGSSKARAPTPPATMTRKTTPAASSAERRTPSGPLRASQLAGTSPSKVCATVSAKRRPAGVPPTTE